MKANHLVNLFKKGSFLFILSIFSPNGYGETLFQVLPSIQDGDQFLERLKELYDSGKSAELEDFQENRVLLGKGVLFNGALNESQLVIKEIGDAILGYKKYTDAFLTEVNGKPFTPEMAKEQLKEDISASVMTPLRKNTQANAIEFEINGSPSLCADKNSFRRNGKILVHQKVHIDHSKSCNPDALGFYKGHVRGYAYFLLP